MNTAGMTNPAIPRRTLRQGLQHILDEVEAGRVGGSNGTIGACLYESYNGIRCGIGCMFTPEQIAEIKELEMNSVRISVLVRSFIGEDNLKWMTGMSVEQAGAIQIAHDSGSNFERGRRLVDAIKPVLEGKTDTINGVVFKLEAE